MFSPMVRRSLFSKNWFIFCVVILIIFIGTAWYTWKGSSSAPLNLPTTPSVSISSPKVGQVFIAGDSVKVNWNIHGISLSDIGDYRLDLQLYPTNETACGYPVPAVQLGTDVPGQKIDSLSSSMNIT